MDEQARARVLALKGLSSGRRCRRASIGHGRQWQVRIRVDGGDLECTRKGSGRDKIRRVRRKG